MKKKILAICGSTATQSANLRIIQRVTSLLSDKVEVEIYEELSLLPHFNPDLDKGNVPGIVERLRNKVTAADGVLICTPEYVFSLPGSLKNTIEWCVSTTIFSDKPVAFITASASGVKAHESLKLVLETIGAGLQKETQLLIRGAKGKVDKEGNIIDTATEELLKDFADAFAIQLNKETE